VHARKKKEIWQGENLEEKISFWMLICVIFKGIHGVKKFGNKVQGSKLRLFFDQIHEQKHS
jgi:hypothetical protein